MNFTALKSNLSRLAPVLHTRTPLPILSSVRLTGGEGFLVMEASNLNQHMKITMPYEGPALGCCVGLKRLMSVPGDGEVAITQNAHGLVIKGSGFSAKLKTLTPDEFPDAPALEGKELVLEADYEDALKWVVKAVAGEREERLFMQGINFGPLGMVGADGKRFHIAAFEHDLGDTNIPAICAKMIAPLLVKGSVIRYDKRAFSIEHGDTSFVTRLIAAKWPDVASIIPHGGGAEWPIDTTALLKLIATVPPSQSAPWIVVTAGDGKLVIKQTDDGNDMEVEMEAGATGTFRCSQQFLSDMMAGFSGEQVLQVFEEVRPKATFHKLLLKTADRTAMMSGMDQR